MKKFRKIAAALLASVVMLTGVPEIMPSVTFSTYAASKLSAPKGFKAKSTSKTSITLTWNKVSGADGYRIFMHSEKTDEYETYDTVKSTTYTVEDLSPGKTYKFKVAAVVKRSGKYVVQTKSSKLSVKTKSSTSVTAPKNITTSSSTNSIKLSWSSVSGASAYRVYLYDPDTEEYETYKNVTGTSCTVDGLSPGKKYYFKVATLTGKKGSYKVQKKSDKITASTKSSGSSSGSYGSFSAPKGGVSLTYVKNHCNVYDVEKGKNTQYGVMYTAWTVFAGYNTSVVFTFKNGKLCMYALFVYTTYSNYLDFLSAYKDVLGTGYDLSYTSDNDLEYDWNYSDGQISISYNTSGDYIMMSYLFYDYM